MKYAILVLIMIVSLLASPLRCMSFQSHALDSGESPRVVCECCSHVEEAPLSDNTEPKQDDCECLSCLCHGAVLANCVKLTEMNAAVLWLLPIHLTASDRICPYGFNDGSSFGLYAHIQSSSDARIALQSWQI